MFATDIKFLRDGLAIVDITASNVPATFPLTSDTVYGMQNGVTLAPGSSIYVTNGARLFMLGTENDWEEQ